MAASRPFLFDNRDFDQIAEAANVAPEERPQFSQREMDGATHGAQQRGFEEGLAKATQSYESQVARLLETALTQIDGLYAAEIMRIASAQALAIEIAGGLVRKIMPELANYSSLEGISALVKQVMMDRFEEPRLIIRVHDSVLDNLNTRLQSLAEQSGFRGQYALMADTMLAPTDCRIEWSNGGVERSAARLWDNMQISLAQIQAAILMDNSSEAPSQPNPNESETP